jgi:hypothetical protein
MADISIDGAKLTGVLQLTWNTDHLAHVLDHSQTDEPTGTWPNPRELHQTGAFALVAWWAGFGNDCGWLAAGTA